MFSCFEDKKLDHRTLRKGFVIGAVVMESDAGVGVITVTEPAIAVPDDAPVAGDADTTAARNGASKTY